MKNDELQPDTTKNSEKIDNKGVKDTAKAVYDVGAIEFIGNLVEELVAFIFGILF